MSLGSISVEQEIKSDFGVIFDQSPQDFVGKPADAFEFVGEQEAGVDGNFHGVFDIF
jgi:hypothetical protein